MMRPRLNRRGCAVFVLALLVVFVVVWWIVNNGNPPVQANTVIPIPEVTDVAVPG